jgi:serine/threonine protein kinase
LKIACKKLGCKDNYKIAKLYNKSGLQLFKDDVMLLGGGDILYLAAKGEDFNFSAILDDYQIVKELGQGGFGKVVLGRHKEDKKEVAIKFMDVSENRKPHKLLMFLVQSAAMIQNIYKEAESLKKL